MFYEMNVSNIEIVNQQDQLQKVYFKIPFKCHKLSNDSKEDVLKKSNLDS